MSVDEVVAQVIELFDKINEEVPEKTKKGLEDIERYDREAMKKTEEIQKKKVQYMTNFEKMTPDQKTKAFLLLQTEMTKIADISHQKILIAKKLKNIINEYREQLKIEEKKFIENYPTSMQSPNKSGSSNKSPLTENNFITPLKSHRKKKPNEVEEEEQNDEGEDEQDASVAEKKRGRKKKPGNGAENEENAEADDKSYCWCQLDKQDQMVCCENKACQYEWFHFTCIGMITAPGGDWYCSSQCREIGIKAKASEDYSKTPIKKRGIKRKK